MCTLGKWGRCCWLQPGYQWLAGEGMIVRSIFGQELR